jgi:hypothetical protein
MADNNRTERRLLDSIRKAKSGPDAETVAPTTAADHEEPPTKVPARKSAPRSRIVTAKAAGSEAPTTTRKAPEQPSQRAAQRTAGSASIINRFQRGGRVWPD